MNRDFKNIKVDWLILRTNLIDIKSKYHFTYEQMGELGEVKGHIMSNFMNKANSTITMVAIWKLCEKLNLDLEEVASKRINLEEIPDTKLTESQTLLLNTIKTLKYLMEKEAIRFVEEREGSVHTFKYVEKANEICLVRFKDNGNETFTLNIKNEDIVECIDDSPIFKLESLWKTMESYNRQLLLDKGVKSFLKTFLMENNPMLYTKNK